MDDGAEALAGTTGMEGGTGVAGRRMTEAAGGAGTCVMGGGGESRGTTGRTEAGSAGPTPDGGATVDLAGTTGCAGADGVEAIVELGIEAAVVRGGTGMVGVGGVIRCGEGAAGAAGLVITGGLTDGNPIMVRFIGGRDPPCGGIETAG